MRARPSHISTLTSTIAGECLRGLPEERINVVAGPATTSSGRQRTRSDMSLCNLSTLKTEQHKYA